MEIKFKIGDRVGYFEEDFNCRNSDPLYGEIVDITSKNQLLITFDDEWYNKKYFKKVFDQNNLLFEDDARLKVDSLEKEYNQLVYEVSSKMVESADLISKAAELAKKHGYNLSDMYEAYRPLYSAMDKAGWNTSSFGC